MTENKNGEEMSSKTKKDSKVKVLPVALNLLCLIVLLTVAVICYSRPESKGEKTTPTPVPTQKTETVSTTDTPKAEVSSAPTNTPTPTAIPTPTDTPTPTNTPTPTPTPGLKELSRSQSYFDTRKAQVIDKIASNGYSELAVKSKNWSFKRVPDHQQAGNWAICDIKAFDCFYLDDQVDVNAENKVIYLTLDCGYPTKKTVKMLDILKEKEVHVTFFCTQMFLEKSVDEIKRMREDGHNIGNHTSTHQKLTEVSLEEDVAEITGFEERMYELTGMTPDPFFRCPGGNYSEQVLQLIKDLGYSTYQWSIAYGDYDNSNQPSVEYVVDHIKENYHNGAILLMHNDSAANLEAMPDVIDMLKAEGFTFGNLYDFVTD